MNYVDRLSSFPTLPFFFDFERLSLQISATAFSNSFVYPRCMGTGYLDSCQPPGSVHLGWLASIFWNFFCYAHDMDCLLCLYFRPLSGGKMTFMSEFNMDHFKETGQVYIKHGRSVVCCLRL